MRQTYEKSIRPCDTKLPRIPDPSLIGKPIAVCESALGCFYGLTSKKFREKQLGANSASKRSLVGITQCLGTKTFERQHYGTCLKVIKFESIPVRLVG